MHMRVTGHGSLFATGAAAVCVKQKSVCKERGAVQSCVPGMVPVKRIARCITNHSSFRLTEISFREKRMIMLHIPSRPKLLPTDFLFWGIIWVSVMGYRTEKNPAQNYLDR